ncbi:MAG: recombinase family protein [Thiomicrospira sp.]|jgi:DNA invertase Pin-like site-specific DNA recombinase|nr:recombinase family protein [Thiomicrospira sp.]
MSNIAYLRISTDQQDLSNQKHGLLDYANKNDLTQLKIIEDVVSSKKHWSDRKIGEIVGDLRPGDNLLAPEISRLARSTLEVLEIIKAVLEKGAALHITKDGRKIGGGIQDTIYITVLSLAAEIEKDFIQRRTRESLAKKKQEIKENGYFVSNQGNKITKLGRPRGEKGASKLDPHKAEINSFLAKGVNKASICKIYDVTYPTLRAFIKKEGLDREQGNLEV